MGDAGRFYEAEVAGGLRSAPTALRNREPIAQVLAEWLPPAGLILEIASGTGEHALYFAQHFQHLEWQPSDVHEGAIKTILARRQAVPQPNLRAPIVLDAAAAKWPILKADAIISINMVHISPWSSALGLIDGAAQLLGEGAPLILYGPWLKDDIATAESNLAFDEDLRSRDPAWGLRKVEDVEAEAEKRGFVLEQVRTMPANNLMLLFRFGG